MADELTVAISFTFSKNSVVIAKDLGSLTIDVTGDQILHHVQSIGTSEEAINVGDLGTLGYILLVNRDATNFIEIRPGTGAADLIKIPPGEFAFFKLTMNTPYAIADTGACLLEYWLIEA